MFVRVFVSLFVRVSVCVFFFNMFAQLNSVFSRSLSSSATLVPFVCALELSNLRDMAMTFGAERIVKVRLWGVLFQRPIPAPPTCDLP